MANLLSEADATLGVVTDIISRARALATQAANDTYTASQRDAIETEFAELIAEYTRVVTGAERADRRTLARGRVDVGIVIDNSGSMGGEIAAVASGLAAFVEDLDERGLDLRLGLATINAGGAFDKDDGVTQVRDLEEESISDLVAGISLGGGAIDALGAALQTAGIVDIPGRDEPDAFTWRDDAFRRLIVVSDTDRETDVVPGDEDAQSVGSALAAAGVTVDAIGSTRAEPLLSALATASGGSYSGMDNNGGGVEEALLAFAKSIAPFGDSSPLTALGGIHADTRFDTALPADTSPGAVGITGLSLADAEAARTAMEALEGAISKLGEERARIGASMRRLASVDRHLERVREEVLATRARVVEADMAEVGAELAKTNAVAQVGEMVARRGHEVWAAAHAQLRGIER